MANVIAITSAVIRQANNAQASQALIVQGYANSVNAQPAVDFSADSSLSTFQTQINSALTVAQGHAQNYLTVVKPMIIQNLSNIENYYNINNAVPTSCPQGSTTQQWIQALQALQEQATTYQTAATALVSSLTALGTALSSDSSAFNAIVSSLNSAVSGDDGALASLQQDLEKTQGEIDGAIAGVVGSSVGIGVGIFVICVGAIADFVTAGTSTGAVVAGVILVVGSVGGEVAASIALATLLNDKTSILTEESSLRAEVKLASGISDSYATLNTQVSNAITAAGNMANAWNSLASDLEDMASDLQSGITDTDTARQMFLDAANTEVATVLTDIQTIKAQMAGVTVQPAPQAQSLSKYIVSVAQQNAA